MGNVTPITAARRTEPLDYEKLLTPGEVASIFRVGEKTVTRWANQGRLSTLRTLGGHRRFHRSEVLAMFDATRQERTP